MKAAATTPKDRARTFCAACQVGQGRNCGCRKRRELTQAECWWLILGGLAAFWGLVWAVCK